MHKYDELNPNHLEPFATRIVKIKKLSDKAVLPKYAKNGDAGMDIVATEMEPPQMTRHGFIITYKTGIALQIPEGYVGLIYPRSSISKTALELCNSVGVIDSGYRGEILFKFRDTSNGLGKIYEVGDRIGQIVIMPYPKVELLEVEELTDTERGTGGFGSTNGEDKEQNTLGDGSLKSTGEEA